MDPYLADNLVEEYCNIKDRKITAAKKSTMPQSNLKDPGDQFGTITDVVRSTDTVDTIGFLHKALCKPVSVCLSRLPLKKTGIVQPKRKKKRSTKWQSGNCNSRTQRKRSNDARKQSKNVQQDQILDQGKTDVLVERQDESRVTSVVEPVGKSRRHIPDFNTNDSKSCLHLNSVDSVVSKSHRPRIKNHKHTCSTATSFHTLDGPRKSMIKGNRGMTILPSRKRKRQCLTSRELDLQNVELSDNESNINTVTKVKKVRYKDGNTVLRKDRHRELQELPKLIIPLIKLEHVHDDIHVINWRTKVSATSLISDFNVEKENVTKDRSVKSASSKYNGYSIESFDNSAVSDSNNENATELAQNKQATIMDRSVSVSDEDLIRKYKLLKELKVFLIRLDNIKNANSSVQFESRIARRRRTADESVKDSVTSTYRKRFRGGHTPKTAQNNDTYSAIESSSCVSSSTSDSNRPELFQEESSENLRDSPKQTSKEGSCENLEAQVTSTIELSEERLSASQEKPEKFISSTSSITSQSSENAADDLLRKSFTKSSTEQTTAFLNNFPDASCPSNENSIAESTPVDKSEKNSSSNRNVKQFSSPSFEKLWSSTILLEPRSKADTVKNTAIVGRDSTKNIPKKVLTSSQLNLAKKSTTNLTKKIQSFNEQSDYSRSTCSTSSPAKSKLMKPDKTKHKVSPAVYKCIICYLCFEEYAALQQHLSNHVPKTNAEINTSKDLSVTTDKPSKVANKTSPVESSVSVEAETSKQSDRRNIEKESSSSVNVTVTEVSPSKKPTSSTSKSGKDLKKRPKGRIPPSCNSSNCGVCLKSFETKTELAEHLYSHTEAELREAFEQAETKVTNANKNKKTNRSKNETGSETGRLPIGETTEDKSADEDANESASTITDTSQNSSRHINHEEVDKLRENNVSKDLQETIERSTKEKDQNDVSSTTNKYAEADKMAKTNEVSLTSASTTVDKCSSERNQSSTETVDTIIQVTRPFVVCACHKDTSIDEIILKIEILLLCHSCRVLFRTVECLETHYRLPEYILCQKNRSNGRSPKLFCTNCEMVFGSVQYVRQHLEMHARMEKNPNNTIDFRCNICKVVFVGIGPLFYIHWSQHMKNPFFLASRLSFPKNSLIDSKCNMKNTATNDYLYVAEHICNVCKLYFGSEGTLKKHLATMTCKQKKGSQAKKGRNDGPAAGPSSEGSKIQLVCGVCNDAFLQKTTFYQHAREKHGQHNDPKHLCVPLPNVRKAYICNICVNTFDTLEEFEKHWVTHLPRESFICMHCQKCCKSFESFEDHSKQHISEVTDNVLACKVVFNEHEFQLVREGNKTTSKRASPRRKSSSAASKAKESTSVKGDSSNSKKKSIGKETSAPVAKVKPVSAVPKPCEAKVDYNLAKNINLTNLEISSVANMQTRLVPDVVGAKESNAEQQRNEKQKKDFPLRSKEKDLTSVMDNTEDDSEHELTIDMAETAEESDNRKHEEQSNTAKISGSKSNVPLLAESPASSKDLTSTATSNPSDTQTGTSTDDSTASTLPTYIVTPSTLPQYILTAATFYPPVYTKTGLALSSGAVTITPMLQPVVQIHTPTVNIPPAETLPVNDKEKVAEASSENIGANSSSVTKEGNNTRSTVNAKTHGPSISAKRSEANVSEKDSTVHEVEPVVQKGKVPPKPKHGFLRVKSLAELMPKVAAHICTVCGLTFETLNALSEHSLVHGDKTQKSANVASTDLATRKSNVPPARSNKVVEKSATKATTAPHETVNTYLTNARKLTAPLTTNSVSSNSSQVAGTSMNVQGQNRATLLTKESQPVRNQTVQPQITPNNRSQVNSSTLNANTNNCPSAATSQNSTSAYHKNLPVCNFARASIVVPLSTVQKGERALGKRPINAQDNIISQSAPSDNTQRSSNSASSNVPSNAVPANSAASHTAENAQVPQTDNQTTVRKPPDTLFATGEKYSKYKCLVCPTFSTNIAENALTHKKTPEHLYLLNQYTDKIIKDGVISGKPAKKAISSIAPMANNNPINLPNKCQRKPVSQTLTSSSATPTYPAANRIRTANTLPKSNKILNTNTISTTNTLPTSNSSSTSVQYQQKLITNDGGSYLSVRPTVSNIPMVTIPRQQLTYQPQFYTQPVVYTEPSFVPQQQVCWLIPEENSNVLDNFALSNVVSMSPQMYNFSGSTSVNGAMAAQYQVPVQQSVTSYGTAGSSIVCCPHCDNVCYFATNESLQLHVDTYHNFICEICNQRWFTRNNFSLHLMTHNMLSNANRLPN